MSDLNKGESFKSGEPLSKGQVMYLVQLYENSVNW